MEAKYKTMNCPDCKGEGKITHYNGAWVREKRLQWGVGLREMARDLKISASFLSDVELGKRRANADIIDFIEKL